VVYCPRVLAILAGSVAQWLTVAAVIVGAWLIYRGGGGTALETLQTANRILERRVHDLEAQGKQDARLIAELKGKTDMALAIKPFMEWGTEHETRAQERHEGTLHVLELIAARLGPDADGGH